MGRSVGMLAGEELERVRDRGQDRLEALDGAARRAREVADERGADGTADAPGQHPEHAAVVVADPSHRLGQPGCLAIDHSAGPFRCEVPGPEAGPPGRHDEAREPARQLPPRRRDLPGT